MSGLPQRSSAAASPDQDHRSQPMSQLVFPVNPTAGNRFNASNGVTYIFDGVVWTSAGDSRAQERTRQEQQERERQARRVQELERQVLELKKGLETVRALAEA